MQRLQPLLLVLDRKEAQSKEADNLRPIVLNKKLILYTCWKYQMAKVPTVCEHPENVQKSATSNQTNI